MFLAFLSICQAGPPAVELETIEAAAAFEKENRSGGERMAIAVLSPVDSFGTSVSSCN